MYQVWKLRSLIADRNDFVLTHYPIVKETRIFPIKIYYMTVPFDCIRNLLEGGKFFGIFFTRTKLPIGHINLTGFRLYELFVRSVP